MVIDAEDGVQVAWHDLECGLYRADLPLWLELAADAAQRDPAAPVLDLGAGTGRVTLELAAAGHPVIALDLDAHLLAALERRAHGLPVRTVHCDARSLSLTERDLGLCIAPMQTVQLLGGREGRIAMLQGARERMRPGAILACAIVTEAEAFDTANGDVGPGPEVARTQDGIYVSRPVAVHVSRSTIRIERVRRILHAGAGSEAVEISSERNVIDLDVLDAAQLKRDGRAAGLSAAGVRVIRATDEHVGSEVVMLRA
jgi:SAM-dependent methyltransferase